MIQSLLGSVWQSGSSTKGKAFAQRYTLEERRRKRMALLEKCGKDSEGDVVCVVVEMGPNSRQIKEWVKHSYIFGISKSMTLAQLMVRLSSTLKLQSETGMFYYCKQRMLRPDISMHSLEAEASKEDGFVYLAVELQASYGF